MSERNKETEINKKTKWLTKETEQKQEKKNSIQTKNSAFQFIEDRLLMSVLKKKQLLYTTPYFNGYQPSFNDLLRIEACCRSRYG